MSVTTLRGLSQLSAAFIASWCQGIHRKPLVAFKNSVESSQLKITEYNLTAVSNNSLGLNVLTNSNWIFQIVLPINIGRCKHPRCKIEKPYQIHSIYHSIYYSVFKERMIPYGINLLDSCESILQQSDKNNLTSYLSPSIWPFYRRPSKGYW